MEKIRNLSLKKTILLYLAVSLMVSFLLSGAVVYAATRIQYRIWENYTDMEKYQAADMQSGNDYRVEPARPALNEMSAADRHISETCDFLETYAVLVFSMLGSAAAVGMFYKNKLKPPIEELHHASQMIAQNELDFQICYENRDELGQLCREFDRMRAQLAENNSRLWRAVEDEKALRAAIAHDIRSPLAVLRGYQEMLLEFAPTGTLSCEKITEILRDGMNQIDRLNGFIETMRKMTRLEEREIYYAPVDPAGLREEIEKTAGVLCREAGKSFRAAVTAWQPGGSTFQADRELILEVADNLIQNAARYAGEHVDIRLSCRGEELTVEVVDDGEGFSQNTDTVTKPFYHGDSRDNLQHFGMGMYISRVYCERHGGRLITENTREGGAAVKAIFSGRT